jgi:hypothetical protein
MVNAVCELTNGRVYHTYKLRYSCYIELETLECRKFYCHYWY